MISKTVTFGWLFFFGFNNWQVNVERDFHLWLKQRSRTGVANKPTESKQPSGSWVANGDDAAVVDFFGKPLVIATDTIAEGTHFLIPEGAHAFDALRKIGRKAMAVSLSDIAAMGATPSVATLNFQCPKSMVLDQVTAIYEGADALAGRFDVDIVGGDTNSWAGSLVITSTVFGTRPKGLSGWSLEDARIGDAIFVSGEFGGSIHGRHLTFEPRLSLSEFLVEHYSINAATDATDSLTSDLLVIARASQVRMEIDLTAIPVSPDVRPDGTMGQLEHALCDGEDFELIFTLPPDEARRLSSDARSPTQVTQIGTVVSGSIGIVNGDGHDVVVKGYNH